MIEAFDTRPRVPVVIDSMPTDGSSVAHAHALIARMEEIKRFNAIPTTHFTPDDKQKGITRHAAARSFRDVAFVSNMSIPYHVFEPETSAASELIRIAQEPPFVTSLIFVYQGEDVASLQRAIDRIKLIIQQVFKATQSCCFCISLVEWRVLTAVVVNENHENTLECKELMSKLCTVLAARNVRALVTRKIYRDSQNSHQSARESLMRVVTACVALSSAAIGVHQTVIHEGVDCSELAPGQPSCCQTYMPDDGTSLAAMTLMTDEERGQMLTKAQRMDRLMRNMPGYVWDLLSEANQLTPSITGTHTPTPMDAFYSRGMSSMAQLMTHDEIARLAETRRKLAEEYWNSTHAKDTKSWFMGILDAIWAAQCKFMGDCMGTPTPSVFATTQNS